MKNAVIKHEGDFSVLYWEKIFWDVELWLIALDSEILEQN